jgi:hypothetical protein
MEVPYPKEEVVLRILVMLGEVAGIEHWEVVKVLVALEGQEEQSLRQS